MKSIIQIIAQELNLPIQGIQGAVTLLDEGATVPFVARYRKEMTGGMDDNQLRLLDERLAYLRDLNARRETILKSIQEQGKLTESLEKSIMSADTKTRLEDLYLPYKPKRRTKGQMAIEAGLLPLADQLYKDQTLSPEQAAEAYVNPDAGIEDVKSALDGARYILMERLAEDAELLNKLRQHMSEQGRLSVSVMDGKEGEGEKFQDYFNYDEALSSVPSHRMLAVLRGRNEGILRAAIEVAGQDGLPLHPCEKKIAEHIGFNHQDRLGDDWMKQVVAWTWSIKLNYQIESELISDARLRAEKEAIEVFANNLKDLLLAAPAGPRTTLGLDPGYRTGVKFAVVDSTGKILDHGAIFPHAPQKQWDQSLVTLAALCAKHQVELISIGNGTASRETDKLAAELLTKYSQLNATKIMVSEAGASVYSASEFASREFPDLDVTIRGAISIARRLQDPLAELVKIDPKAIGVGQYQHDVNQVQLARGLDAVVEDCVNAVGVDLNTASAALLARVSGLSATAANNIISYREENGHFKNRHELLKVSRLGPKVFEQAAGFLRIRNSTNPLDSSSVHPESYHIVEAISEKSGKAIDTLIGDSQFLRGLNPQHYVTDVTGAITIRDILKELEKPGRDPRPEFKTAEFKDGVEKLSDLKPGMILEGVVTNVTNFGAFVDVGVHQDGLVHISALSNQFVKDPRDVVKAGQIVKVKVMEVEVNRKRIALSMRLDDQASTQGESKISYKDRSKPSSSTPKKRKNYTQTSQDEAPNAMAEALMSAMKKQ